MCNDRTVFVEYKDLEAPLNIKLGDGYEVDAVGRGVVVSGRSQTCKLQNVPRLSYNVSVATENGKTVRLPTVRFCSTKGENCAIRTVFRIACTHTQPRQRSKGRRD